MKFNYLVVEKKCRWEPAFLGAYVSAPREVSMETRINVFMYTMYTHGCRHDAYKLAMKNKYKNKMEAEILLFSVWFYVYDLGIFALKLVQTTHFARAIKIFINEWIYTKSHQNLCKYFLRVCNIGCCEFSEVIPFNQKSIEEVHKELQHFGNYHEWNNCMPWMDSFRALIKAKILRNLYSIICYKDEKDIWKRMKIIPTEAEYFASKINTPESKV